MVVFLSVVGLLFGFFCLIKGADFLVEHSVLLAKRIKLSPLVIGIFVVSIGTSIPEFIVVFVASWKGSSSDLIVGNIIGSNIANVFLVLGIMALFLKIPIDRKLVKESYWFNGLVIGLLIFYSRFFLNPAGDSLAISRLEGISFLVLFALFIYRNLFKKKLPLDEMVPEGDEAASSKTTLGRTMFFIALAIVMLSWGGNKVVEEVLFLAREVFKISEGFIGLTIIAVGTSLPEIITSLLAGKKKQINLALGNVLGSNLFNVLWVLSFASLVRPLSFNSYFIFDMLISLFSILLLGGVIFVNFFKREMDFKVGLLFLSIYATYLVYLFYRG